MTNKINITRLAIGVLLSVIFLLSACVILLNDVYALESDNAVNSTVSTLSSVPLESMAGEQLNDIADDLTDRKEIPNSNYFVINPSHHTNYSGQSLHGVCTTVAVQMLLGYHNYYSDRRLIPAQSEDGVEFLSDDYGDLTHHPNVCNDICADNEDSIEDSIGKPIGDSKIGLENGVFDEIVNVTSFTGTELEENLLSVRNGTRRFLEKYSPINDKVTMSDIIYSLDDAKSEIDAGRPIVLCFVRNILDKQHRAFHVVVAYGYATYQGEFGYIVHWGHSSTRTQIWVPESWFYFQLKMNVEHTHSFVDCVEEEDYLNAYRKLECSECGCTTLESLYNTNEEGNEIVSYNYAPKDTLVLPDSIGGVAITSIGAGVFANSSVAEVTIPDSVQSIGDNAFAGSAVSRVNMSASLESIGNGAFAGTNITDIKMPTTLVSIGDRAFENCEKLTTVDMFADIQSIGERAFANCGLFDYIYIPTSLTEIGKLAFEGCNELEIYVDIRNPNYSASGNVLFFKYKTEDNKSKRIVIGSGKVDSEITFSDSVTEIAPYAFANNCNVQTVRFGQSTPVIRDNAFAYCVNLSEAYVYSFDIPETANISPLAFANDELTLYVPYICQDYYNSLALENVTVSSDVTVINFVSDDVRVEQTAVYYGSYLGDLPTPAKTGYSFTGWYTSSAAQGAPVCKGDLWKEKRNNATLYAGWSPKSFVITFAGEQSQGLESKTVTYDAAVGELPVVEKQGYTFLGWKGADGIIYKADTVYTEDGDSELCATWRANNYAITFDGNGGTPNVTQQTVTYDGQVLALATCERHGYLFTGWNTELDGSGENVAIPFVYQTDGDVTLYAQWEIVHYSIIYNLNGGVQAEGNPDTYTVLDSIVLESPTKTGYTFVGWKSNDEVVTSISGIDCCDIVLDAEWQANSYTVAFDVNGGLPQIDSIEVTFDESFEIDVIPAMTGHELDGWYDASGVKYLTENGSCVRTWDKTDNATLYARWYVKSFEIQINDNGSITWLGANGFSEEHCTIEYGAVLSSINLIATFKQSSHGYKDGRIFDHFEYGNGVVDWTSIPDLGENGAIITITPVWVLEQHTVYFNTLCNITLDEIVADYEEVISLPGVNRSGYIFDGWYLSSMYENKVNWVRMPDLTPSEQNNGSVTLFAKYSLKYCFISYELDGGVNSPDNHDYISVESAPLSAPAKLGYKFAGWYLDEAKTQGYSATSALWETYDSVTLYAKWTPNTYKVSYNPNGGVGYMMESSHTYDAASSLTAVGYEKQGYTFAGWSSVQSGDVEYLDNAEIVNLIANDNETVVLYACWQANKYKVKYKANGGEGTMSATTFTYDVAKKLRVNAFTKVGYNFAGWSTVKNGEVVYTDAQKVKNLTAEADEIITLYAKWTAKTYTVYLDNMGGRGQGIVTATYGEKIPSVTSPTLSHYYFRGYYSEPSGRGTLYINYDNPAVGVTKWDIDCEYVILYAFWEERLYNITLHTQDDSGLYDRVVQVSWGDTMPIFQKAAPTLKGCEFVGYFDQTHGNGTKYYRMEVSSDGGVYYEQLVSNTRWYGDYDITLYCHFKLLECDYTYECVLQNDENSDLKHFQTVHLIHGANTITAPAIENCSFDYFYYNGKHYATSPATLDIELYRNTSGVVVPVHNFHAIYIKACIAPGTLITLADGSQVAVENLTGDEELLVWNLQTGEFDTANILFIDKDPVALRKVINLSFSDGTQVKVISEHAFWNVDLNEYVYLKEDAAKYIGHHFNKQVTNDDGMTWTTAQLVDVVVNEEYTSAYSPITYGHFCYYVNGMLSIPGGISGLINIFEVDSDTMTVNAEAMARDIEQYGLFTYEELSEVLPISQEVFDAFNGQYLKVAIGKGLTSIEALQRLVNLYADFLG